jgi:CO/xanthine dehydrogenase FAD-binding subunit
MATLAGNLMVKHTHRDFPSDIFLVLETVGAKLEIGYSTMLTKTLSMMEFLKEDMRGKLIVSIILIPMSNSPGMHFRTFKVGSKHICMSIIIYTIV